MFTVDVKPQINNQQHLWRSCAHLVVAYREMESASYICHKMQGFFCERLTECSPYWDDMDVHVLRGIISSGVFLPPKDEMAQTTHVILDTLVTKQYKFLPQSLLNKQKGMEWVA